VQYLSKEFLLNCHEPQDNGKEFHYAWILLLISVIAWRLPEDSQFPPQDAYLPEATKFTSLCVTKDPERVMETKIFWVLVEIDLCTVISQRPRLSPNLFEKLEAYAKFNANFHNISIYMR